VWADIIIPSHDKLFTADTALYDLNPESALSTVTPLIDMLAESRECLSIQVPPIELHNHFVEGWSILIPFNKVGVVRIEGYPSQCGKSVTAILPKTRRIASPDFFLKKFYDAMQGVYRITYQRKVVCKTLYLCI